MVLESQRQRQAWRIRAGHERSYDLLFVIDLLSLSLIFARRVVNLARTSAQFIFFFFFYRRASIGRFRGTCNSSRTYWSRLKKKFFLPIWELISRRIKELAEVAIRQTNKSQLSARTRLLYSDISWHLRAHRLIVGRVLSEESMSDSNSWLSAGSHDLHYSAEKGFSDLSSFSPSAKGISARLRQRINLQLPFNLFRRLREAQASLAVLFEVVRLGTWLSIRMHFFFWWYK